MSKKKIFRDSRQKELDFSTKIDAYRNLKEEILDYLSKKLKTKNGR